MQHQELINFLRFTGQDPSRLIFEDELTGLYNRRFLLNYFQHKVAWTRLEDDPLSLIMMDVDRFKQVNDGYGHQVGDQVLVWIAALLKEITGDAGLAMRYAGDEFMILLVHADRQAALAMGNRFLKRVRTARFRYENQDIEPAVSLSLGVASAPQDARSGKDLIRQADVALYYAKKIGRNCIVNAGEVDQEAVFAKTAVNLLEQGKLVGRGRQLARVTAALNQFSRKQNQFLIAKGPAGIGKTEFLETIRRHLARINIWRLKVGGDAREMFRPYYLMTRILMDILNQQKDGGSAALAALNPLERSCLAQLMPQPPEGVAPGKEIDESARRQGLFTALHRFFVKLAGSRPVIMFIDDMHFADEATLLLLRQLMLQQDFSLFVCGACQASESGGEDPAVPLATFYHRYGRQLGIQKVALTPLTAADIAQHIFSIFPNAQFPDGFEKDLARVSRGNPLFLSEFLRKLVQEDKVSLVGRQWVIAPFRKDDLPRSLEEMVAQKIAALDEEDRRILDQVSVLGEDVSLSMLTGSSNTMEARVLDFIDQAAGLGLLDSDFQRNDEVIRFLGKRVLEITYGAISQDRRRQLHAGIGTYQEILYRQRILPSAAPLAYHFELAADRQKAGGYAQLQQALNIKNFNGREAVQYSVTAPEGELKDEIPLNPADLQYISPLIRNFIVAVRNIKLYPAGSKSITAALERLKAVVDRVLKTNPRLSIARKNRALLVNSRKIDVTEFKLVADAFLQFLNRAELQGITFQRGLSGRELNIVLQAFGQPRPKMFDPQHWQRFAAENRLTRIELQQIRYAVKAKSTPVPGPVADPRVAMAASVDSAPALHPDELGQIPAILHAMVAAVKTIKLYPPPSASAAASIEKVMAGLHRFFGRQPTLTLSRAGETLLVNGEKVDPGGLVEFRGAVGGFLTLMDAMGVESLTFLNHVSGRQLEIFIGAVGDLPGSGVDAKFWQAFAARKGLAGILFDQQRYEVQVAAGPGQVVNGPVAVSLAAGGTKPASEGPIPPEFFEDFLAGFARRVAAMFLAGRTDSVKQDTGRLLAGLHAREFPLRSQVVDVCGNLLDELNMGFRQDFAKLLVDPLLQVFAAETEPKIVVAMASLLSRLATEMIQLADYPPAARLMLSLRNRCREFKTDKNPSARRLAASLDKDLPAAIPQLLLEDLKSGDAARQQAAAQLLGSLGPATIPLLVNIVRQEEGYRIRQIAAGLIRQQGPRAVERLKRLLGLEISAEERSRILEVIDTVTSDLKAEFILALGDDHPQVRAAACRLSRRLNDDWLLEVLREAAGSDNSVLATSAVKCLAELKPPEIEEALMTLLNSSRDDQVRAACCRALGQIARPACIEPLLKILLSKGFLFFRKKRNGLLRPAAAFALEQIGHPKSLQNLAQFVNDRDLRVREIARRAAASLTAPPPT